MVKTKKKAVPVPRNFEKSVPVRFRLHEIGSGSVPFFLEPSYSSLGTSLDIEKSCNGTFKRSVRINLR